MTKQQGGGFVMRDSRKKRKEKVTIQEEKRRQRLIEEKKTDRKGKVDCIALSNKISHLYYLPRCSSLSLCVLAEQAFASTSSSSLQHRLSAQNSSCKAFCNAWHSFSSTGLLWFHNHCRDGFLMTARSGRVISNIHHSEATRSGQDVNQWEGWWPLVMMLYQPLLPLNAMLANSTPSAKLRANYLLFLLM